MVGQGRPNTRQKIERWLAAVCFVRSARLRLLCAFLSSLCGLAVAAPCSAEDLDVRLRFAWGSSSQTKQQWTGQIEIEGGTLSDLQPLGIEPDESAALLLVENRVIVAPPSKRGFDGFDVSVRAQQQATLRIRLSSDPASSPKMLEVPLEQVVREPWQVPLDDFGSMLLVHRSPGDRLRVKFSRESLIFQPEEIFRFQLQPDLPAELAAGPVQINLQLRAAGGDSSGKKKAVLWETSQQLAAETPARNPIDLQLDCPAEEGAYRLTIEAYAHESFAGRLVPGKQAKLLASRDVELVVLDPHAKLPALSDRWEPVLSFDPANPKWWQRMPAWARVPQFSGASPGARGNVRPLVRPTATGDVLELPPLSEQLEIEKPGSEQDPPWQAYTLAVQEPGIPHLLEIEIPRHQAQHLAISIVEPDAAGRVMNFGRDSGVYVEPPEHGEQQDSGVFRMVFWPRTHTPQVVLVNRHPTAAAQFSRITLSSQSFSDEDQPAGYLPPANNGRIAAGYIATPRFVDNMGAAELFDPKSGLSVDSWSTFLEASKRLAQYVRYRGYNGVLVSVSADSSALYPSRWLGQSPRYDTGVLAASGQDPIRKDVLELLLRIFDREGLRLVPTLQLATPLPQLEALRQNSDPRLLGTGWVNAEGRTWLQENAPQQGRAPYYNPLNHQVQRALVDTVSELAQRYAQHESFAGVAMQLSGDGFAVLPGPEWGMDDSTVASFCHANSIEIDAIGPDRFEQRADRLLGSHAEAWRNWRTQKLTQLYQRIASALQAQQSDLPLILATENLFAGPSLQRRLRLALTGRKPLGDALLDHGIDLAALGQVPGMVPLSPHRLAAEDSLQLRALDGRLNVAARQAEFTGSTSRLSALFYHVSHPLRLASYDQLSAQGPSHTHYSTSFQSHSEGEAARRPWIHWLAQNDTPWLIEGGELLPLGQIQQTRPLLRTWQQLPGPNAEVRTETQQPLVSRVYREAGETTVCLINEAPWPLQVELPLDLMKDCSWERLHEQTAGTVEAQTEDASRGTLVSGANRWQLLIPPYDLQAWRFRSAQLRVGTPSIRLSLESREDLLRRIEDIEARTGNLNIRRPYSQLINPSFEQPGPETGALAWQTLPGNTGMVQTEDRQPHSGSTSMHLQSAGQAGAAVQSQPFAMPETGQLVVSVYLRGERLDPNARLEFLLQNSTGSQTYLQTTTAADRPISSSWSQYEFSVDDLPLAADEPMRLQFRLTGSGDVWIDDVGLFDLQFDEARRLELVKKVYAARTALDQQQVVDCMRLVNDYWSRYLVEYVPSPIAETTFTAQAPADDSTEESPETDEQDKGFGRRVRGFVPRLWR